MCVCGDGRGGCRKETFTRTTLALPELLLLVGGHVRVARDVSHAGGHHERVGASGRVARETSGRRSHRRRTHWSWRSLLHGRHATHLHALRRRTLRRRALLELLWHSYRSSYRTLGKLLRRGWHRALRGWWLHAVGSARGLARAARHRRTSRSGRLVHAWVFLSRKGTTVAGLAHWRHTAGGARWGHTPNGGACMPCEPDGGGSPN